MPLHERKQIRDAVAAMLVGHTAAGARVFPSRAAPLRAAELPALAVYTLDEAVDPQSDNTAPVELRRTVQLMVDGFIRADQAVDDAFDALALEIETALDTDRWLTGTAFSSVLKSTETGLVKMDGDRPMGCVTLEYSVVYHTDARVAAVADDFSTADIRFSLSGAQAPNDQAHDSLEDLEA